jgi:mannose-P-dolichol utilization defect protein 1
MCAAVAIIVITAMKLNKITLDFNQAQLSVQTKDTCLLGKAENGANLCYFAYAVSGISIIATGILSILQCCTCHLCGLGGILDVIFAAVGTAVWAVAGVVFLHYDALQPAWMPLPEWRRSIPALSFVACALFGIMCLASLWSMMSNCCCKGRSRAGKGRRPDAAPVAAAAPAGKAAVPMSYPQPVYHAPPAGYPQQGQFMVADSGAAHQQYWGTQAARF